MEIGTSTHAIAGFGGPGKPFRQAVAEIAGCGFRHFLLLTSEIGPPVDAAGNATEAIVDARQSDLSALLRTAASHGLRVSCLYPGFSLDFSAQGVHSTSERLAVYREMAWRLGCHVMVHSAGQAAKPRTPLAKKKEQIQRVAEVMDTVASDRPGQVFKLAVDVHYGGIIETVADCEYLLARTQECAGLCLNTGHMTTLGQSGWELLARFPERIHVIAWKDHLLGDELPKPVVSCELGQGKTPLRKYVDVLRTVPCGAVHLITFEDVPLAEKEAALKRSREFLAGLLQR